MRPRTCARKPTDAHTSSRTHIRAHTYIRPCTHVYARIRSREGNFLTTNLLYSIAKPSSIISPTPFTSIIQSLYNPYQYWNHIGGVICTNCQHLPLICYILSSISNHYPTIHHLSFISHLSPIHYHCFPSSHTHHILFLSNVQSNSSSYQYVSSIYYKTLSILYISAALPICFLIYNRFLLHQPTL